MIYRRSAFLVASLLFGLLALAATPQNQQGTWDAVNDAIRKGLPKTAIEQLQLIQDRATSSDDHAEAIKAIAMKVALEGNVQGGKPEEKIIRMRAEIEAATAEMRPVMEAIVANWFWHYLQQNRWRFMQRTPTAQSPGEDFTTWDLPRLLSEIDQQFDRAFANSQLLKTIPIEKYDALFEKGSAPDAYRPTVFDFVAHNALGFYASGEQVASQKQDAFTLSADDPVFDSTEAFLAWELETRDDDSLVLRALQLHQDLLQFHAEDLDRSALLDCDLARINFGFNQAKGDNKNTRYQSALARFAERRAEHPVSSRANHELAQAIFNAGDYLEARRIANIGLAQHPDSVGGRRCFNLIQQLEAKEASIVTERVWGDPRPIIKVSYRNVSKIYFRLVPYDFLALVRAGKLRPEQLDKKQKADLLNRDPVLSWEEDLPVTKDLKEAVVTLKAPDRVALGSFYLLASHNPSFAEANNQVTFTEVWESDLAVVLRNHSGRGLIDGFVLDSKTGKPIPDASVDAWQSDNRNQLISVPSVKTNSQGLFEFRGGNRAIAKCFVRYKRQSLATFSQLRSYQARPERPTEETRFFTDRAIYRPGQTIRYKAIAISVDKEKDNYRAIAGRNVTIILTNANGQELERVTHQTNQYGSFSGSVTAPADGLMGRTSLRVVEGPRGATQVSVEEYKRPKFQVEIDAPDESPRLGDVVGVSGKAMAYTGAAINGAEVRWRIVREVRYPVWWSWRYWWMPQNPSTQEIAHGVTTTDSLGRFSVDFEAKPDLGVERASEPTFQFTVYADVTDRTGETRTSQKTIRVGYTALSASINANRWLTNEEEIAIGVTTTTIDGQGKASSGILEVYEVEQPEQVQRRSLAGIVISPRSNQERPPTSENPYSWPVGELVKQVPFKTNGDGQFQTLLSLDAGIYRAKLESVDQFGEKVTADLLLQVLDPKAEKLNIRIPHLFTAPSQTVEAGQEYLALWGSGYDSARAYIEIEHRGKILQSFWTDPKRTQQTIRQNVSKSMRGGFYVRTTMVRENRAYTETQFVDVPWDNKKLDIKWERLVSKLEPGAKETWTAIITGEQAKLRAAEMVATLYDASLDALRRYNWPESFDVFRRDRSYVQTVFQNQAKPLILMHRGWLVQSRDASLTYRSLPSLILQNPSMMFGAVRMRRSRSLMTDSMEDAGMALEMNADMQVRGAAEEKEGVVADNATDQLAVSAAMDGVDAIDLNQVSTRKNLQETAFFFPHLVSDGDGVVKMTFTMPEALTEWKFLGFAHDQSLRGGLLSGSAVTSKDLMIQPNPPRFLREGDQVEFTVKVTNQSPTIQSGIVSLSLADAATGDNVDAKLGNSAPNKKFEVPAGESLTFSWRLAIPDQMGFLTYKAVGSSGRLSDGEEGFLPVLPRRVLVQESIQLPIRGPGERDFEFERLLSSGDSDTLKHQSLTVQMTSNPSWYAVLSLPYLMEFPHECNEQVFNRFYANALAQHITISDPRMAEVFERWRGTDALESPMQKNQDLQSLMLVETPWIKDAEDESQARRNVGILFDENRLKDELDRAFKKLSQTQLPNGAWSWMPGGRDNRYITLYITTGFGRLRHLGVKVDLAPAIKSLAHLDDWMHQLYQKIKASDREQNHLSSTVALYLYGRSFFLDDQPITEKHQEAVNYWISQSKSHWLDLNQRQSQAHLAIALKRFGDLDSAKGIMQSIHERSVNDSELGRYWRDTELSWWWYRAPIETQAMMIEAFDEVMNDQEAVEDCKVWLLKQKQTRDWKTTKATADAAYALLLRGSNMLSSDELVSVSLGGKYLQPGTAEAGTGFYQQRFSGAEVKPDLGSIRVKKIDDGVAWGGVHWQYLEDLSQVTPHDDTPLSLTKKLYVRENSVDGPVLRPIDGPVRVGDELVVRMVLRSDRDMEYLHLKDQRGSGTEPVDVISSYRYQDGLAYYQSTRDTASHFFIDYLPKGTYIFEYASRVQLAGQYQSGFASIESMYAPEFKSHSQSTLITVER